MNRLVEILRAHGWECPAEVTFSVYGERGSIDILARHPRTGRLLVVEVKSVVPDMQSMLAAFDRKARLAPAIAAQRGWRPNGVGWAIVLAGTTQTVGGPCNMARCSEVFSPTTAFGSGVGSRIPPAPARLG